MKLVLATLALMASVGLASAHETAMAKDAQGAASGASAQIGAITLSGGFARATLPNQPVGGGYVALTNTGTSDDRLIAAQSPVAGEVQLHEMAMKDGVMVMRQLENGIALPAGKTVTLQPGGYHLMFMQLKEALVQDSTVQVTLTFEQAGTVTVDLPVMAPNATGGAAPMHGMTHAMPKEVQ
ncbi:copper chaperone PCu(A)C [Thioclava sp. FTW29]|uniref:Copper chaperone PCu(A)C n=1 Tax=Thioclava litoralis TaxID=3076557 RepID=A0ABZ1E3T7_9RHOB|nr:copper chaperone PCu(A)C [Thioclava sp. FTW29]